MRLKILITYYTTVSWQREFGIASLFSKIFSPRTLFLVKIKLFVEQENARLLMNK